MKFAGQTLVDHFRVNTLSVEVRGQKEKEINGIVNKLEEQYKQLVELGKDPTDPDYADNKANIEKEITKLQTELKKISKDINIDDDGNISFQKDGVKTQVLTDRKSVV